MSIEQPSSLPSQQTSPSTSERQSTSSSTADAAQESPLQLFGRRVFDALHMGRTSIDLLGYLRQWDDNDNTFTDKEKDLSVSSKPSPSLEARKEVVVDERTTHGFTMEDMMPLSTWQSMRPAARQVYLDQFLSIADRYRLDKEATEMCAKEELDAFQCYDQNTGFQNFWKGNHSSWLQKMDPCVRLKLECDRCQDVMNVRSI